MGTLVDIASPLEVAALLKLGMLTGDDIAAVCMRWLEQNLDSGDPDIATFAGQPGLQLPEAGPPIERFLAALNGRSMERDEALLRALNIHLAVALQQPDVVEAVAMVLGRFAHTAEHRLVHHPRRATDDPTGVYAEQNLGLEYIYGGYYAFDDIGHLSWTEQARAADILRDDLRKNVRDLHDHLTAILAA